MQLSDVFVQLGEDAFGQLLRSISIGKLKTYQLFERFKTRLHLAKLNQESLRKAVPRLMQRLREHDEELATDVSQSILISHFDMIVAVLNFLKIPHEEGFFIKDLDPQPYLTQGWKDRVFQEFQGKYADALLLFYINHLAVELAREEMIYVPRGVDRGPMESSLAALQSSSLAEIAAASNIDELEAVRVRVTGRKGVLAEISKGMGKLAPDDRVRVGRLLNETKGAIERSLSARKDEFEASALATRLNAEWLDLTIPSNALAAAGPRTGSLHPVTQIQQEIEDLFRSMGFAILDGPESEDEYHNFDALNIPTDHPARDMQDTFWLEGGNLLRTHTSPVQVRGMERYPLPLRMIAPGRVFRNESVDASHEHTFYQLEGMMIDRDISVANLIYFMQTLLAEIFQRQVTVRLRPGFFPFVEPGFELDIHCLICGGTGCPVCKQSGWVELLPCGLVNPNVLRMSNIDPNIWNGFAFGLGLTRLVMMRYAIDDIRLLQSGDLRFLNQF